MIVSNQQREENFQEYLRLLHDPNYYEVVFDDDSGGVSAIHNEHNFDKQVGAYGVKRGQYEKDAVEVLRKNGHSVILLSETPIGEFKKHFDALLDGIAAEIKAVEGSGHWSIRTKIQQAVKQGASYLILYYPDKRLFSEESILSAITMFLDKEELPQKSLGVIPIVEGHIKTI